MTEDNSDYKLRNLTPQEHTDIRIKIRALLITHLPPKTLEKVETILEGYNLVGKLSNYSIKWINELYDEYR